MARRAMMLALPAAAAGLVLPGCAASPSRPPARLLTEPTASVQGLDGVSMRPLPGASLPPGWAPYVLRRDLPMTHYESVMRDGRQAIHASGTGGSSGLRHALPAGSMGAARLAWEWRVDSLDLGASVSQSHTDDCPARMVVSFAGDESRLSARDIAFYDLVELVTGQRLPFATLMYVWDAQLAVGSVVPYSRSSRVQYLVVESGPQRLGQWLHYERDLNADYLRVFGEAASGPVTSIGLLTDSDDLKAHVQAWYANVAWSPLPEEPSSAPLHAERR